MDKEILKKEIREEHTKIKGIREKLLKKMDEDDWEDFKQFEKVFKKYVRKFILDFCRLYMAKRKGNIFSRRYGLCFEKCY